MPADLTVDSPRLPAGLDRAPTIAQRPAGAIPPLQTTAPTDLAGTDVRQLLLASDVVGAPADFSPLAVDPPPNFVEGWGLRLLLFGLLVAAPVSAMWTEVAGEQRDIATSPLVISLHLLAVGALIAWSFVAMRNARLLIAPTLYHKASSSWTVTLMWAGAVAAPMIAAGGYSALRDRINDPDNAAGIWMFAVVVLVAFVLVWLPFGYHARQARRIGAPQRTMLMWFWAPLIAVVGGIAILSLGLRESLAVDGLTKYERLIQVGVAYGLPMVLFALATSRAVTAFDEVLVLRWRRWKNEWEQTIEILSAQPLPGSEDLKTP